MVDVLEPYSKEIKDLKTDLPKILRKILIDNKVKILNILKEEQLGKGLNSQGQPLVWDKGSGFYAFTTEHYYAKQDPKPRKTKVTGKPYNFEWSGGTFDKMYMFFEDEDSYSLFSKDSKASMLEEKFGEIFQLTEQNNERINQEILRPAMYDAIINRLFL